MIMYCGVRFKARYNDSIGHHGHYVQQGTEGYVELVYLHIFHEKVNLPFKLFDLFITGACLR